MQTEVIKMAPINETPKSCLHLVSCAQQGCAENGNERSPDGEIGDASTRGAQQAHEKRAEWHGDPVLAKTVSEGLLP